MDHLTPETMPTSAQQQQAIQAMEYELETQDHEALRRRVQLFSPAERDRAMTELQRAAERAVVDPSLEKDMALLVGLPVVLGYRKRCEKVPQALLTSSADQQLGRKLQGVWSALLPGLVVAAMPVAVRLDVALAADPADVRACADQAAALLQFDGDGQYSWRSAESAKTEWAMPPIPAVYLLLGAVQFSSRDGAPSFERTEPMGLRAAAGLLRGIFATKEETPYVAVAMPQPFFKAAERALAGELRFAADPHVNGAPTLGRLTIDVRHGGTSRNAKVRLRATEVEVEDRDSIICSWNSNWEWRTETGLAQVIEEVQADDGEGPAWMEFPGFAVDGVTH